MDRIEFKSYDGIKTLRCGEGGVTNITEIGNHCVIITFTDDSTLKVCTKENFGMCVDICMYKESGKYYTSHTVWCAENIELWDDRFKQFILDNLPAKIGNAFVVIDDVFDNQGFHMMLTTVDKLNGCLL